MGVGGPAPGWLAGSGSYQAALAYPESKFWRAGAAGWYHGHGYDRQPARAAAGHAANGLCGWRLARVAYASGSHFFRRGKHFPWRSRRQATDGPLRRLHSEADTAT